MSDWACPQAADEAMGLHVPSLTSGFAKLTLIHQLKYRTICREEAEKLRLLGA
jgi:hypothetical protein